MLKLLARGTEPRPVRAEGLRVLGHQPHADRLLLHALGLVVRPAVDEDLQDDLHQRWRLSLHARRRHPEVAAAIPGIPRPRRVHDHGQGGRLGSSAALREVRLADRVPADRVPAWAALAPLALARHGGRDGRHPCTDRGHHQQGSRRHNACQGPLRPEVDVLEVWRTPLPSGARLGGHVPIPASAAPSRIPFRSFRNVCRAAAKI
mmetsp:Transcript_125341/g.366119  ORF Transcript_125341/g.366119 Transcript_125341/m.366119 type:complete len:205 (+) Transcript_125341:261-875(+)